MNTPGFGLFSESIIADPDSQIPYRETEGAKKVLVSAWGLGDAYGEGKVGVGDFQLSELSENALFQGIPLSPVALEVFRVALARREQLCGSFLLGCGYAVAEPSFSHGVKVLGVAVVEKSSF